MIPEPNPIYLRPGEIAIVHEPAVISTVLGSCVSFTFFHSRRHLAGMCHALLPHGDCGDGYRYVDSAGSHLLDSFLRRGVPREEIEVKLFGGADMFEAARAGDPLTVGEQNVAAARAFVEAEGLRLRASDVGGSKGRKVLFYAHTGEIFVKKLRGQEVSQACCHRGRP